MIAPVQRGKLTTPFGPKHLGIDIGFQGVINPPIMAWRRGVVHQSTYGPLAGNTIVLRHDLNTDWCMLTRYCHLKQRNVFKGDQVDEGEVIGIGGNTGSLSTGPHLHLEMLILPIAKIGTGFSLSLRDDYAFDPRAMFSTYTITGEGLHMIKLNPATLPTARPTDTNLRYRIAPSLKGKIMGSVKVMDHPYLGATDPITEIDNGKTVSIKWAKLLIEDIIVYASLDYLIVTEPKIREPLHAQFTDGTISVKVDTI